MDDLRTRSPARGARTLGGVALLMLALAAPAGAREVISNGRLVIATAPSPVFITRGSGRAIVVNPRRRVFVGRRRHIVVTPRFLAFGRFDRAFYFPGYLPGYAYAPVYAAPVYEPAPVEAAEAAQPASPGQNCREIQATVTIDGRRQPVHGRACQWLDGTWHLSP